MKLYSSMTAMKLAFALDNHDVAGRRSSASPRR